ncbi:Protease ecfE, putative, partial [Ricinus communis]
GCSAKDRYADVTFSIIQTVLITAATLGVLVTIHEFGHFWVARRCGVKVLRFAIGFGKPLLRWRDRHETEFVIAAIPLGGYVKMLDEREGEVPPELTRYCFNRLPASRRIAVVAAGPIANFLLAIVVYWVVFMAGVSGVAPIVGGVQPDSLSAHAGLQAGDEIIAIDGEKTPTWQLVHQELIKRIGESGELRLRAKAQGSTEVRNLVLPLHRWLAGEADPDMVGGLGIEPWHPAIDPVIEEVLPDSPAAEAGLQKGDRLIATDGQEMKAWDAWVAYVRARPGQSIAVDFEREGVRRQ